MIRLLSRVGKDASMKGDNAGSAMFEQMVYLVQTSGTSLKAVRWPAKFGTGYEMQNFLALRIYPTPKYSVVFSNVSVGTTRQQFHFVRRDRGTSPNQRLERVNQV